MLFDIDEAGSRRFSGWQISALMFFYGAVIGISIVGIVKLLGWHL